jgi:FkbM family methyltransferase
MTNDFDRHAGELRSISAAGARAVALHERVLCRVLGQWKFFVDSRDMSQTPDLIMDGIHQARRVALLQQLVEPGWCCVVAGGTYGWSTLIISALAQSKPAGRVFAFEPNPRVFSMLKSNVEMNDFDARTKCYPQALGSEFCTCALTTHRRRFDSATLNAKAASGYGQQEVVDVDVTTLDSIMATNKSEPDFIELSCVGYEPEVWAGMENSLKAKRKVKVLMDFHPRYYADAAAFGAKVMDCGFRVTRLFDSEFNAVDNPEMLLPSFRSTVLLES